MCSGRVDPGFILNAFHSGADGVLICGCHPGDCHYVEGNYKCMRRIPLTKKLLEQMGIDSRRLRLEWVSASEGARFQSVVTEFTEQIRTLGPLKLRDMKFDINRPDQYSLMAEPGHAAHTY
jgi:F420-non-reducing hydrogenase iron-sulfur subunit